MNDRKLRIFYEVAKHLNMSEVAQNLYISQPAISQAIHEIENELQVKLFDRIGKRLYLTNEGKIFLQYTRRVLNIYEEAIKSMREINNLEKGRLDIGASTTIGIYILPDIIGKFKKLYSGIDISIYIENTHNICELILENKIDIAFVEGPVYSDEFIVEKFCDDELVFICSKEHPWCEKSFVSFKDIEKESFIMRENGSGTREVVENFFIRNNKGYNISFELGNTEAIKKAVEAGLGMSCISKRCISKENNKLSCLRIRDKNINRELSLIYHKDKYISKLIEAFIDFTFEEVR